jgi:hypothetical protein
VVLVPVAGEHAAGARATPSYRQAHTAAAVLQDTGSAVPVRCNSARLAG